MAFNASPTPPSSIPEATASPSVADGASLVIGLGSDSRRRPSSNSREATSLGTLFNWQPVLGSR